MILKNYMEEIFKQEGLGNELNILDIGCADIRAYSLFLISIAKIYVGIDINDASVNIAKIKLQNVANVIILKNSIEEFSYPSNFFVFIVCNKVLAYTNQPIAFNRIY